MEPSLIAGFVEIDEATVCAMRSVDDEEGCAVAG
jgi:hypothetical protein